MVFIDGRRNGYIPEQCGKTMTVGELIAYLEKFDEDSKVYLRNDNGYTYGNITESSFSEKDDGKYIVYMESTSGTASYEYKQFDEEEEAVRFCEDKGWQIKDEEDYVWNLVIRKDDE